MTQAHNTLILAAGGSSFSLPDGRQANKYEFVDLVNSKPFMSFSIKSFDDIVDGKERLTNA